jgi:hypothetical protein
MDPKGYYYGSSEGIMVVPMPLLASPSTAYARRLVQAPQPKYLIIRFFIILPQRLMGAEQEKVP